MVGHDLTIQPGASLVVTGFDVGHDLKADGAATVQLTGGRIEHDAQFHNVRGGPNALCGVSIGHDLSIQDGSGDWVVGNPSSCPGNTIGHDVRVQNTQGEVVITGNTIGHALQCQGNFPVPEAGSNLVNGSLQAGC